MWYYGCIAPVTSPLNDITAWSPAATKQELFKYCFVYKKEKLKQYIMLTLQLFNTFQVV